MEQQYRELFSLRGKTAVVTGALGIIGKKVCCGLAEFGAKIVAVDLDSKEVLEFADELSSRYGVSALGLPCNVADPEQVSNMVRLAVSKMGNIHILHNNAASKSKDLSAFLAPFEEYDLNQWNEVMSVNLDGMFLVAKEVGNQMIRQGFGGVIIQTASIYGIMGPDHRIYEGSYYMDRPISSPAVYAASKGGVVSLTKYLATYWAKYNIRVNTITPGGVESGQNEEFKERYSSRIPLGRMAAAEDMVGAVIYLASDASRYVTGHNLIVDGGLNAW